MMNGRTLEEEEGRKNGKRGKDVQQQQLNAWDRFMRAL